MSDAFADAVAEADQPVVDEPVVDFEGGADPAADAAALASDPTTDVEPEDSVDWRQRYEEAQKLIGRQGSELGELRRAQEAAQEWEPEPAAQQANPLEGYSPTQIASYLSDVAAENPMVAFQQSQGFFAHAMETGNLTLARRIAKVVDESIDPDIADRMTDLIDDARIAQRVAPLQETYQAGAEQQAYNEVTDQLISDYPDSVNYAAEIAAEIRDPANTKIQRLVENGDLEAAFELAYFKAARGNQNSGVQSDQTAAANYKQSTMVPTGGGRLAPQAQDENPEEAAVIDMLSNARTRRF